MNNEIKEILDNIKDYSEHEYLPPCCELTNEECKHLLDYITNLDKKNKELKKKITFNEKSRRKMQQSLMEQIEDYKSRIGKAVEYINHLSKEPNVFGHYGIHNDCAKWLLNILNGRSDK